MGFPLVSLYGFIFFFHGGPLTRRGFCFIRAFPGLAVEMWCMAKKALENPRTCHLKYGRFTSLLGKFSISCIHVVSPFVAYIEAGSWY